MGRRQLFDSDEVLLTMMQLFRSQGFHATSLRDLEAATGLHPGSLHRSFGNKDEIFRSALDAYVGRVVRGRVAEHLERGDDPIAGIRSYFTSTFETGLERDPGCLVTNSVVESYALDELTTRGARRGLDEIERGFVGAVERARAAGQVPAGWPAPVSGCGCWSTTRGCWFWRGPAPNRHGCGRSPTTS